MVITPDTDVILLKCPLELDQANQLNFANTTAQYNYFYSLPKKALTKFKYVRKDGVLAVGGVYDDLADYNYVMYRNHNFTDKWFYAFIERAQFISPETTWLYIKTDVFQTYQFDLTYKASFIEREHVNDDTVGLNTLPEGLECGEYQILKHNDITLTDPPEDGWGICFCVTTLPEGCTGAVQGRVKGDNGLIGGVFNSLKFFAVLNHIEAKLIMRAYEEGSVNTDAIINIYMIPRNCMNRTISLNDVTKSADGTPMYPLYNYYDGQDFSIQQKTTLAGGYQPRNKKLFVSPFSYVYMSNNAGEDIALKWEDFPLETIGGVRMPAMTMYRHMIPSASLSAKLIFKKYKNYTADGTAPTQMVNYGITYAKVPVCAWTTDYYTNWLTQNGVNVQTSVAESGLSALGQIIGGSMMGMAVGGPVGGAIGLGSVVSGLVSGFNGVASAVAQTEQAKSVPDQAHGNICSGDLVYSMKRNSISCYQMSVREEVARVVDGFFDMYGYKVNKVKLPNVTGRTNWNYIKTIGCYILADIHQEDLQEIKNMFDNGVTIWHNPSTFRDYSQSNAIVS